MNKLITIALILMTARTVSGQPFEGKITYRNSFVSKLPNLKNEEMNLLMGNKQIFYIRGGDYKSVFNGTFENWQLYSNSENKLYSKFGHSDTIFWNHAGINDDTVFTTKLTKDKIKILGYSCDELILMCKSGVQKYYYNSSLRVNSKLYERLIYANWYYFLKRSNAVPLKIVLDSYQFSMESVAIEVKPMKIEDRELRLPANSIVAKSPY